MRRTEPIQCPCKQWKQIDAFSSFEEYKGMLEWIGQQIKGKSAHEIVELSFVDRDGTLPPERMVQCTGCGSVWRFIEYSPPVFKGAFLKLS